MATKLVQPSMTDSHVSLLISKTMNITKLQGLVPAGIRPWINTSRYAESPLRFRPITIIKVAEQNSGSGLLGDETLAQKKRKLYQAVKGINRGIFGIPSAKKFEIESLVKQLESQNPTPDPTLELEKVAGCWRLVYSTISILGSKRTKLGLRDFISLDEFLQTIDIAKVQIHRCPRFGLFSFDLRFYTMILNLILFWRQAFLLLSLYSCLLSLTIGDSQMESKAVNVIKFSAKGLGLLSGQLSIEASFTIASSTKVDIDFENSTITPDLLMNVFRKNYDLLLGIFNPEGWLEITYVDDTMRIGRDDKSNIFVLERFEDSNP